MQSTCKVCLQEQGRKEVEACIVCLQQVCLQRDEFGESTCSTISSHNTAARLCNDCNLELGLENATAEVRDGVRRHISASVLDVPTRIKYDVKELVSYLLDGPAVRALDARCNTKAASAAEHVVQRLQASAAGEFRRRVWPGQFTVDTCSGGGIATRIRQLTPASACAAIELQVCRQLLQLRVLSLLNKLPHASSAWWSKWVYGTMETDEHAVWPVLVGDMARLQRVLSSSLVYADEVESKGGVAAYMLHLITKCGDKSAAAVSPRVHERDTRVAAVLKACVLFDGSMRAAWCGAVIQLQVERTAVVKQHALKRARTVV